MTSKYRTLLNEVESAHRETENLHRDSRVLIVDAMNLFIRVFSAIPTQNEDGMHVGGLTGFLQSLGATIRLVKPTRVVIVFDGKGGSARRREMYSSYKEGRAIKSRLNRNAGFEDLDDEQKSMKHQLLRIFHYLQELPVTTIMIDHVEADDVIAYLASYFKEKVTILSNDKDFLQLVSDRVEVYVPTKKKMYTPRNLLEEYGVWYENFGIYKALKGDKSDNIKPIRGFGDKTILKLFPELAYRDRIDVNDFLEKCKLYDGTNKAMKTLKENVDVFVTNYKLVQLTDVDISASIKSNIRGLVDCDIQKLNKVSLSTLATIDKINLIIPNWELWVHTNFNQLDAYRTVLPRF